MPERSLQESFPPGRGASGGLCSTGGDARAGRRRGPLDALYALAFLGSGDPHAAEQTVIDAVSGLCGHPGIRPTCPRRRWRFLADHVHRANESSRGLAAPGPAPFRDAGLSLLQQEVVALRLGAASHRRGARLVGVPVSTFGRQLRSGLRALAGAEHPDPAGGRAVPASAAGAERRDPAGGRAVPASGRGECPGARP